VFPTHGPKLLHTARHTAHHTQSSERNPLAADPPTHTGTHTQALRSFHPPSRFHAQTHCHFLCAMDLRYSHTQSVCRVSSLIDSSGLVVFCCETSLPHANSVSAVHLPCSRSVQVSVALTHSVPDARRKGPTLYTQDPRYSSTHTHTHTHTLTHVHKPNSLHTKPASLTRTERRGIFPSFPHQNLSLMIHTEANCQTAEEKKLSPFCFCLPCLPAAFSHTF